MQFPFSWPMFPRKGVISVSQTSLVVFVETELDLIDCSAIEGYETAVLVPQDPTSPSAITEIDGVKRHIIFTAETHNFPTGINKLLKKLERRPMQLSNCM